MKPQKIDAQEVSAVPVRPVRALTEVVAALIWRGDSILVQKRLPDKPFADLWELPGGKVHPGEQDAVALVRECEEELGVHVQVGNLRWSTCHRQKELEVCLRIYDVWIPNGQSPRCLAASAQIWQPISQLQQLQFCPADTELIEAIATRKIAATMPPNRCAQ